jgi:outer membrane immunogenic protein
VKKVAIGIIAVAAMIAAPVFAAEIPVKAPPPTAPVWSWNGFYVGGDLGTGTWTETVESVAFPAGFGAGGAFNCGTPCFDNLPTAQDFASKPDFGGFHAGFNWQAAPTWLLGVEGDFMLLNRSVTKLSPVIATFPGAAGFCPPDGGCLALQTTGTNRFLASARARIGYIHDRWLVYATGGAAWTDSSNSAIASSSGLGLSPPFGTPGVTVTQSWNGPVIGWVAGAGMEVAAFGNWALRAEYLHYEFGGSSTVLPYATAGALQLSSCAPGLCNFAISTSSQRFDSVRLGLSYRFGGGSFWRATERD